MNKLARAGAQDAAVTWHCSKAVPFSIRLSKLGVMQCSYPSALIVSYLCWSVIISMILGLLFIITYISLLRKNLRYESIVCFAAVIGSGQAKASAEM